MFNRALDRLDLKILSTLEAQGRMTNRELAERVGLSQSACLERVRRLQSDQIITGYRGEIDPAKLGDFVCVYALITLGNLAQGHAVRFEKRIAEIAQVVDCAEVSGACDYVAYFVCRSVSTYQDITAQLLNDEALGVTEIKSHIVLRAVKGTSTHVAAALLADLSQQPD